MSLPALALVLAEAAEEKAPPVIDIDGTVVVQFALFVVMYFVLRAFLFKPYLKMRDERSRNIEGAEAKAAEMERSARGLESDFEQRLQSARQKADDERGKLQAEGRAREAELLAGARGRAQTRINETRKQVEAQVRTAQAELAAKAEPIAHTLASRLLGREV